MKKIISCILLLTLCLGLLAGCANESETNTGLANAKTYLYNMYKDTEGTETKVSYERVGVVSIDGVAYNVTWTSSSEEITFTANGKMVTVNMPEGNEEAIAYTLTATISDDKGNAETVSFNYTAPASGKAGQLADGTYVITDGIHSMTALSADKNYGYPTGNNITITDGVISGHGADDILTITNVDGGITIQDASGRYYYLSGTYNSPNVSATVPEEGHIWKIVINGDVTNIINASNGKTLAYSSSYSSWGCYEEIGDDHGAALTIVAATEGDTTTGGSENTGSGSENTGTTGTVEIEDGAEIVLYYATENKYITGESYLYEGSSSSKYELVLSADEADALTLTVSISGDTVTFKTDDGKYLMADGTNVQLVETEGEHTKFVLEAADGGCFIKCLNAQYSGRPQYLEVYKGYLTVYSMNSSSPEIYTFELKNA